MVKNFFVLANLIKSELHLLRAAHILIFALFVVTGQFFSSCRDSELFIDDPKAKLAFSRDTILFDTVFTTIGTTSRALLIYNKHNKWLRISSVKLARGQASPFRINLDGKPILETKNVDIPPKDSLFLFVRATIDPNNQTGQMIETDSIIFLTNGNLQDVKLVAWGEDAYFYNNAIIASNYTLSNDKPHVVYGFMAVDSLNTLTINAGTRLHFHNNSFLLVYRDASLKVFGTLEQPVTFQGDRTHYYYRNLPGQWGHAKAGVCIYFYPGSINNEIHHAIIKNGILGIQADTLGNASSPTLKIYNSEIRNMSGIGLLGRGTNIEAANLVIANCGTHAIALLYGGSYDFRHVTIGNYWNKSARQTPSLVLNNYYTHQGQTIARPLEKAFFGNCIIFGSNNQEITLDSSNMALFSYQFDHCWLKTTYNISALPRFINCTRNTNPKFINAEEHILLPDTLSPLIDKGNISIVTNAPGNINFDIRGVNRISDIAPDIGAYEFTLQRRR